MIWAVLALYEHPANKKAQPTSITGSILKTPLTGVDSSTSFTLNFTEHLQAQAILSCSITVPSPTPAVTIRYRNGNILVQPPIFKPPSFTVQYFDKPGSARVVREETRTAVSYDGGWFYEADEVARCIRDGKLESETWGHDKSILLMEVFDQVRTPLYFIHEDLTYTSWSCRCESRVDMCCLKASKKFTRSDMILRDQCILRTPCRGTNIKPETSRSQLRVAMFPVQMI